MTGLSATSEGRDPPVRALDLYVSPHLDDVALACGGRLAAGRGYRAAVVVTVFAAVPPRRGLSALASRYHQLMGIGDNLRLRRSEDIDALGLLGAQPVHLDHDDCIYRTDRSGRPLVEHERDIFAEAVEPDLLRAVGDDLQSVLEQTGASRCVLPLALGGHRDHVLARRAGEMVAARLGDGLDICYYEDTPYVVAEPDALEASTRGMHSELCPLTAGELTMWLTAITRYRSQQLLLWHGEGLLLAICDYAHRVGGARPAERYWRWPPQRGT